MFEDIFDDFDKIEPQKEEVDEWDTGLEPDLWDTGGNEDIWRSSDPTAIWVADLIEESEECLPEPEPEYEVPEECLPENPIDTQAFDDPFEFDDID